MPSHSHTASCSTNGNHTHGIPTNDNIDGQGNGYDTGASAIRRYVQTANAGNHSHSIGIGSTGGNGYHENRMPYVAVNMWKRTA